MSETIAAVVFDLDGVLLDSESDWDAAWRDVVAHNGGRWQDPGDDGNVVAGVELLPARPTRCAA